LYDISAIFLKILPIPSFSNIKRIIPHKIIIIVVLLKPFVLSVGIVGDDLSVSVKLGDIGGSAELIYNLYYRDIEKCVIYGKICISKSRHY
jgi:hypothetical protein